MIASITSTVQQGSPFVAVPIALAAGLLSFFSPCVLPLVPGYVAFLGGSAGAVRAPAARPRMSRSVAGAVMFVAGFSFVYISLFTVFGHVGESLRTHERGLSIGFGIVTIVLGLFFAGVIGGGSLLTRDLRIHHLPSPTVLGAAFLGVLFGLGWSPCTGPTLAAIIGLADSSPGADAWRGALLAVVYCLGLGLPFIVAAVATDKMAGVTRFMRRHGRWVHAVGGLLLVGIGVLEVTGTWAAFVQFIQDHAGSFTSPL